MRQVTTKGNIVKFKHGKLTARGEMVLAVAGITLMFILYVLAQTVMGC